MNDVMRLVPALLLLAGCETADLPGSYFDVDRSGAKNGCTDGGENFNERLDYRVEYRGNEVSVAVGPDVWATGLADGCTISYDSIAWTSQRNGQAIVWRVIGEALVDPDGGDTCVSNGDWEGTETYVIANSEDPEVAAGCEYVVEVTGQHTQTVE